MADPADILNAVVTEIDNGKRAALCVIVATRGSTPQPAGVMVCVDERAKMTGTLGGGCVEADIRNRAREALRTGDSQLLTFELDFEFGLDEGMICGGALDVAIRVINDRAQAAVLAEAAERIRAGDSAVLPIRVSAPTGRVEYRVELEAPPKLLIAGGGHIGKVIAQMAVPLGFSVFVIDDREQYANSSRLQPPITPVVGDIAQTLADSPIDPNTFVVIVTRGHRHDERALTAVLNSPAKYIGMIGSRRKVEVIFRDLKREGATAQQLERVHAPMGLPINAVTVEEIAVSVVAQLIEVRRRDARGRIEGPVPIDEHSD